MASGNTLAVWTPQGNQPPASNPAVFTTVNSHLVLEFDNVTPQIANFGSVLPRNYAGGGLTVTLVWESKTAITGNVVWGVSVERHQSGVTNIGSDSFAAEQTMTSATPGTAGIVQYATVAFTNGAQMGSLAVGESYRLKVRRVAGNVNDTTGDKARLLRVEVRET